MKLVALIILIAELSAARRIRESCASYNELCVEMTKCPVYKNYSNGTFLDWPESVQLKAKDKLCNVETLNNTTVFSVCCPTVMNSRTCGILGVDKIYYGRVAKPFQFPWMALLRDENGTFVCGGTLISARYVLTAAHCIKTITSVRLGENDINQHKDCIVLDEEKECAPPPQDIAVEKRIRQKYSARYRKNDIALLRLREAAILNHSVQTICLPDGTPGQRELEPSFYIVSGWGINEKGTSFDVLRYARVPSVSLERCAESVKGLINSVQLDQSYICAGGVDQIDSCLGDSGGPLQYISSPSARVVQQGIVAFGTGSCGTKSAPGVYTNVAHFIGWIFEHVDE